MEFTQSTGDFDNLQQAKHAPTGRYQFAITRQEQLPNKAETGFNIEVDLTLVNEPEYEGIRHTMYLALPNPADAGRSTKAGQPMADFKLSMIKDKVTQLGGSISGSNFIIPDAGLVEAQLTLEASKEGRPFNRLDESTITPVGSKGKKKLS